jgi:uncharacterized protein (DUF1778 family)
MKPAAKKHTNRRTGNLASERLEARISAEQKTFFQRAAALQGVTLTDFVIDSLHSAAVRTVEEHDVLKLGTGDRRTFVEALMNPPTASDALRRAAVRFKRMTQY